MVKSIFIIFIILNQFITGTFSQTNVCCSVCLQNSLKSTTATAQKFKNSVINSLKSNFNASKTVSIINNFPMTQLLALRYYIQTINTRINLGGNLCGGISTDQNTYSSMDPLDISVLFQSLIDYVSSIQEGMTSQMKSAYLSQIQLLKDNFQNNYGSDISSSTYLPWNSSPNNFAMSQIITIINSLSIYANQNFPAFINQPIDTIVKIYNSDIPNNIPLNTNTLYVLSKMEFKSNNASLKFQTVDLFMKNVNKNYFNMQQTKGLSFGQNWTQIQNFKNIGWTQVDNNGTYSTTNSDGSTNLNIKLPFMSFQKRNSLESSIFDPNYLDLLLKTNVFVPTESDNTIFGNDVYSIQAKLAANLVGMYPLCFYKDSSFINAFKATCPGSCNTSC